MTDAQPPAEALAWAAEATGGPVHAVRRLAGGTHAATHLLETPLGQAVLRRFPPGDTAAVNEAHALEVLDGLHGWAPRLLGSDPYGAGWLLDVQVSDVGELESAISSLLDAEAYRGTLTE